MATEPETLIPLVNFSQAEKVAGCGLTPGVQGAHRGQRRGGVVTAVGLGLSGPSLSIPPGGSPWGSQAAATCG